MDYLLTLLGVSLLALAASHLTLRRYYGRRPLLWARVELAWWVLCFLSASFAAVQVHDRVRGIERESLIVALPEQWDNARYFVNQVRAGLAEPAAQAAYEQRYSPAAYQTALAALRRVARAVAARGAPTPPRNLYDGALDALCAAPPGERVFQPGRVRQYDAEYQRFERDSTDDPPLADAAIYACAYSYQVKRTLDEIAEIEREHARLLPAYDLSRFWYVLLLAGFALKLTRNLSDLTLARRTELAARREQAG